MIHVQKEIVAMMTESVFLTDHFLQEILLYFDLLLKRTPRPLAKTSLKANHIHMCNYSITVLHTLANEQSCICICIFRVTAQCTSCHFLQASFVSWRRVTLATHAHSDLIKNI